MTSDFLLYIKIKKNKNCTGNDRSVDYNLGTLADGVIGSTTGFDPVCLGSSPGRPATLLADGVIGSTTGFDPVCLGSSPGRPAFPIFSSTVRTLSHDNSG
jgi:hypothetical protein